MIKPISTLMAAGLAASVAAPALAQEATYPSLEVHGYNETYYHIHDINNVGGVFTGGATPRRDGVYVGMTRLTLQPHFNEKMNGFWEVFLFPKDTSFHVNQMDIVGNGAVLTYSNSLGASLPTIPTLGIGAGRLQFAVQDFLWNGNTFTAGQIRNPFGNWDEFSVHRNFVTGKSHPKTMGFLLRRIDLGMQANGDVAGTPLNYTLAFVNRSDSPTVNNAAFVDAVGRLGVNTEWAAVGVNGYVVDQKDAPLGQKWAAGLDFTVPVAERTSLLGEYVRQQNAKPTSTSNTDSAYVRLNYDASDLVPGLRFYTGWDWVDFQGTPELLVPTTGPRNLTELLGSRVRDFGSTYAVGLRYRFLPSATFGTDYFFGVPQYRTGHLHFRLETYF